MIATEAIDDTGIDWKAECLSWSEHRDLHVLDLLRQEGICLACLPLVGPPSEAPLDFTIVVSRLEGITNLVVAAPCWSLERIHQLYDGLPGRQFAHGKTAVVIDRFVPSAEIWFRFQTEIVYVAGVAHEPPYHRAGNGSPWAHCATLALQSAGVESRLRVIHIGLGLSRDHLFLHFLTPHALVPRRVLL
ncbi:MAG TPA: hypothetical protein P5555_20340 [Candidatus Paceibacterota bacterium]|nr:hypothetical protein [Verrucomicrobiota bacterium]HRZ47532.1 hypothetical protein [Candidatus Paceibacterota bacterium]HRZ54814.1 hypothetical protein [Candidatus Paceibacterota bacterium]